MMMSRFLPAAAIAALLVVSASSVPAPPTDGSAAKAPAVAEQDFLVKAQRYFDGSPGDKARYEPLLKSFKDWAAMMKRKEGCFVTGATLSRGESESSDLQLYAAIQNSAGKAIARIELECVVYTPGRTIPWAVNTVTIPVSGGIEHGELKRQTAMLDKNEQQWKAAFDALEQEGNLRLDCHVTRAFDKDGSLIGFFNPTSADHDQLREFENKIGYEGDQLAKSGRRELKYTAESITRKFGALK